MDSNEEVSRSNYSFSTHVCNSPTDENVEFIPSCDEDKKPKIGQTFNSLDEGVEFYKSYAAISGFNTRLGSTLRSRGGDDFISRRVLCNREGKREESKGNKTERVQLESRIGCGAMIYIRRQKNGLYKVTVFKEAHNHVLVSPKSMMFMKENRNMTAIQKTFAVKVARLKIGPVRAFRGWKELSGSHSNAGASDIDFKNFIRDSRAYVGDADGQMFIEMLIRKKRLALVFSSTFKLMRTIGCVEFIGQTLYLERTTFTLGKWCQLMPRMELINTN